MEIQLFIKQLERLGNPDKAVVSRKYHKSNREHWGVSVPIGEQLTRESCRGMKEDELIQFAKDLWNTDLFDPMICAAKIVSFPRLKPSQLLWETIVYFLQRVDGWALEDSLCQAAWKCVLADLKLLDEMEEWTKDVNFWMRRAALVYTLPFAKQNRNPERSLSWASQYAVDSEWFIQKAIGWWLRVLGEHNPDRVILFLNSHWRQLKGVARKEATRKLKSGWQEKLHLD